MKEECLLLAERNLPEECPETFSIERLTGDASTRSYFRIGAPRGEKLVLMKMPEPFAVEKFPYLENYRLFGSLGVRLAEIYHMNPQRGYVFLQDLGDLTFYELYPGWDRKTTLSFYLRAIELLRQIEAGKPSSTLTFDTHKFLWELNYFEQYFLKTLRGIALTDAESAALQKGYIRLSEELSERPRVFCHRDYHSRNLMVQGDTVYVIDFQDARFGPVTYDLASLCYDSYIQLPPDVRAELERVFFAYHPDATAQRFEYPRMCLQRNLKALGTFGYQASVADRPFYLQFVQPTLAYARAHFEKLPEYAELRRLLAAHVPELA